MRVAELWRYPVKSLQGERLDSASLSAGGVEGDRAYAIYDLDTGLGLTARRVPELLFASASILEGDRLRITLPDGTEGADDAALSAWLDRPVELRSAEAQNTRRYENPIDFEHDEPESAWAPFEGAEGAFHDSARVRVSMVSTATIGDWDRRRFRSNLLLEGEGEDALVGNSVAIGGAVLDVGARIERCVMTTRAQPGGLERDVDVMRTLARERDARLAVGALVSRPGTVSVGDGVTITTDLPRR